MVEKNEEEPKKRDRKVLTLFFVTVFSLMIAMTRAIDNFFVAVFFQVVLIFVQIIFVKSILDSFMPEY